MTGNLPLIGAIPALMAGGFSVLRPTGAERTRSGAPRVHISNNNRLIGAVRTRDDGPTCRGAYFTRVELHQLGGPAFCGTFGLGLQLEGCRGEKSERHSDDCSGSQFGGHSSIHVLIH